MTILGVIAKPDRILMWCDTETFDRQGACPGEAAKLAIAPLGPLAVCGSGRMVLIRLAAKSLQASASIDKLEHRLATELRIAAARLAPEATRHDQAWCCGQVIVAGGYSPAAGRMVAWRFDGSAMFEPVLTASFLSPGDAGLEAELRIHGMQDLGRVARRQIELFRRWQPEATGKTLIAVEMTEHGAHCVRVPNFFTPAPEPGLAAVEPCERPEAAPVPWCPAAQYGDGTSREVLTPMPGG